jgi:hypothetical protein
MGGLPDCRLADVNQAAVALFSAIVALAVAGIGFLLRLGFSDNSPLEWAKYVGLSWFLLHFSLVARKLLRIDRARQPVPWWSSHASLTLAALALATLAGVGRTGAESTTVDPALVTRGATVVFNVLGAVGFVLALAIVMTRGRPCRRIALLAFAGLFSLYAASAAWGTGLENPLFVEDLCFGRSSIDTLFHASICNMLRTYGVPSTGLDGLPYIPYHFGSHWIFARLCNLLDVRVIDFYNRGYPIVFVPLGIFSLGTFAVSLAQTWRGFGTRPEVKETAETRAASGTEDSPNSAPLRAHGMLRPIGPLFWFVLLVGYIGFLPYASGFMPIPGLNSIILSESYALAVCVSLLTIASAWSFFGNVFARHRPRLTDFVVGAVVFAVLVMAIGLLKISVMLVLLAAAGFLFARLRLYRSILLDLIVAAVVLAMCVAYRLTSDPGYFELGESRFVPFGFPRANVGRQWWPNYWFIYYAWVWVIVAVRFREEGIRTVRDLWCACRDRKLLDLEFVFVAALAGAGPGLLIMYSGTHYFSNYQQWLALGVLLSILIRGLRPSATGIVANAAPDKSGFGQLTIGRLFAGLVLLSLGGTIISNTLVLLDGMVATNLAARGHASRQTGFGVALMHGRFKAAHEILAQTAAGVESRMKSDKRIITMLNSLDEMPLAEKRRSLLFIPKSNRPYWDLLHGPYWPKEGTFIGPALSGVAMIDGLYVPAKDDPWIGHGYNHYSKSAASIVQPPLPQYLPILRSRCAQMGFSQLIVIDSDRNSALTLRKYDCR